MSCDLALVTHRGLLELGLVEPTLFVADAPAALERLVGARVRRLAGRAPGLASRELAC